MSKVVKVPYFEVADSVWDMFAFSQTQNLNYQRYFIDFEKISYGLEESSIVLLDYTSGKIVMLLIDLKKNNDEKFRTHYIFNSADRLFSGDWKILLEKNEIDLPREGNEYSCWQYSPLSIPASVSYFEIGKELVVDLSQQESDLWVNMSRNHRRTIEKSRSQGMAIKIIDKSSSEADQTFFFDKYREAHRAAAKLAARPESSYSYMLRLIREGIGTLYMAHLEGEPVSFLYCDRFQSSSRGWSQVTPLEIKREYFPRTFLEWNAILDQKAHGVISYHLGFDQLKSGDFKQNSINTYKYRFHPSIYSRYSLFL